MPHDYLEQLLSAELGNRLLTTTAHDPLGTGWQTRLNQANGCQIFWGQVVDALPFVNAYRVCAGPRSYLWCCDSSIGSYQPIGARPLSNIPIGSFVYYITHPQMPWWGVIIGAEPPPLLRNQYFRADYIWPGSRSGIRVESSHQLPINGMDAAGAVVNWSAGRPVDQTTSGEWGVSSEAGLAFFLDTFMAYMRVDESTGLFLFLHDALARLAGSNLQIRSSVAEREDLDDESEVSSRIGTVLHFWELFGAFTNGQVISRTFTNEQVQGDNADYSVLEPAFDDQQPFFRLEKDEGYLGQGGRRALCLPPTSGTVNRYSESTILPGVFEESLSAAGTYAIRSAKGIYITKRPAIPIPKLVKRPEDTSGDTSTNYNASGGLNSEQAHIIVDEPLVAVVITPATQTSLNSLAASVAIAPTGAAAITDINIVISSMSGAYPDLATALERLVTIIQTYPSNVVPHLPAFANVISRLASTHPTAGLGAEPPSNLTRAAAILDLGAFAFNWSALHPYAYHHLDYYLPEEESLPISYDLLLPEFSNLASGQYLSAPTPITLAVDHRYGNARYYPNESGVFLLPDGSIQIVDGFGSEILMTGGSIFTRAAGDIWHQAGKNVNTWAGRDAIIKAQHSADMTAATKDIHIKAEHNTFILGGNNGICGGVEIESRAPCASYNYTGVVGEDVTTTGIVLKAATAQVVCWGRDVILWADPQHAGNTPGTIVLNSGNRIKSYCDYNERFIRNAAIDFFTNTGGTVLAANEFWATSTLFGSDLRTAGNLETAKCFWANGNITVTNGHIATQNAATYGNMVATLFGADLTNAENLATDTTNRETTLVSTYGAQEFDAAYQTNLNNSLGTVIYSLRNTGQYQTETMILFESRWQQMARLGVSGLPVWNEPVVTANAFTTYPHPGQGPWTGTDESGKSVYAFYTENLDLYSFSSGEGSSIPRGANQAHYETPVTPRPNAQAFAGNYSIIVTPT